MPISFPVRRPKMTGVTKHIVFDWNSTLLDDAEAIHLSTNRLLESAGHPPMTLAFFQHHYAVPFRQLYHNLGLPEAESQRLIDLNNSAFHDHYEPLAHAAPLRDGAMDVLRYAQTHGVQSTILSNHLVESIRVQLRRLDIEHFFAEVLAYADRATQFQHMTKGEKLRQFRATQKMDDHPTMIVGDSVEEIEIARDQNFISVAITGGCVSEQRLRAAQPDYVIHSLHELRPILQERGFAP